MKSGDLALLSDVMEHGSVQTTRDLYAVFRGDELSRKHNEFSAVATHGEGGETLSGCLRCPMLRCAQEAATAHHMHRVGESSREMPANQRWDSLASCVRNSLGA